MGMYTEVYVNVDLKEDIPQKVFSVLDNVVNYRNSEGYPGRWAMLFGDGSYYTPLTSVNNLTYDGIREGWSLLGKGDIKNYKGEIEAFFEFIAPWVYDEGFIGYIRYEEDDLPTVVSVEKGKVIYRDVGQKLEMLSALGDQ